MGGDKTKNSEVRNCEIRSNKMEKSGTEGNKREESNYFEDCN